jgi:hypothetical protein
MKLEKVKRKIAEGYPDETIANMSGMSVEEIQKLRNPPKPPPKAVKAPARKPVERASTTKKAPTTK